MIIKVISPATATENVRKARVNLKLPAMTHARVRKDFLRRVVVRKRADDTKLLERKENQYPVHKNSPHISFHLILVNSRSARKLFFVFHSCKFIEKGK